VVQQRYEFVVQVGWPESADTPKSFADDVRESVEPDAIGGKGVVAENGPVGIDQDEWCGDFPPCVLAGL
jgi:hypothetical protein